MEHVHLNQKQLATRWSLPFPTLNLKRTAEGTAMARSAGEAERILESAMSLADERSWEAVRLFDVARSAGVSLDDIRRHYREKEALVDAWFDRADQALLDAAPDPALAGLPAHERIERLLMVWLNALKPHHRVNRQMILGRLEPGHLHVQIPALLRISRTVQWLREAAQRDATYLRRALEETALTGIYVTTFCYWLRDDSHEFRGTRALLRRLLRGWSRCTFWDNVRQRTGVVKDTETSTPQ